MQQAMVEQQPIVNLEQLLERIRETASDQDRISLETVLDAVASRSFGPLLLLAGLVAMVPGVGDIPGVTTIMALLVFLTAGQLLLGRKRLWLPGWMLRRSVSSDRLCQGFRWLDRPAAWVDRLLRPRLVVLAHRVAIAAACIVVAAVMPLMEVVPFGAIAAGAALSAFGLALVAHDGLLALLAYVATGLVLGLGIYQLI